jgi:hypothetical protein
LSSGLVRRVAIALMMEAASPSETSVNFYQIAGRNNPEDNHFHTRRRKNLKSHHEPKVLQEKIIPQKSIKDHLNGIVRRMCTLL